MHFINTCHVYLASLDIVEIFVHFLRLSFMKLMGQNILKTGLIWYAMASYVIRGHIKILHWVNLTLSLNNSL